MKLAVCCALAACTASGAPAKVATSPIPAATTQLVTAIVDDWSSTTATLQLWRRAGSAWEAVGDPWPGVIGSAGAAWGDGLHGRGAPADRRGPIKHEGDRTSPAGAFALRAAYGYAATPPPGTTLPYTASDARWRCVDDPASTHYAQIVDNTQQKVDWKSAEEMKRPDELYTWVVDIAHNPDRIAGDGSCIFLHVWHDEHSTTVGCTAMDEARLAHLLATLDAAAHPVYVLLPRADYLALAPKWGLPNQRRLGP